MEQNHEQSLFKLLGNNKVISQREYWFCGIQFKLFN